MKSLPSLLRYLLVVCLGVATLGACANSNGVTVLTPQQRQLSEDAAYVIAQLKARQAAVTAVYYDLSLGERLPNVLFSLNGGIAQRVGKGIVVGEIATVEPGRGYVTDGEEAVNGRAVSYDAPEALWRTMSVTVTKTEGWGDPGGERISFGLSFDGDADRTRMLQGVRDLGQVIVALGPQGSFDHDRSLYTVARNGSLLGYVEPTGDFAMPVAEELEPNYVGELSTLASLREAAKRPTAIVRVVGGVRVR